MQIWALDSEGEINGVYRDGDVPGLYIMMGELLVFARDLELTRSSGNLAICRLYSKYVAMRKLYSPNYAEGC